MGAPRWEDTPAPASCAVCVDQDHDQLVYTPPSHHADHRANEHSWAEWPAVRIEIVIIGFHGAVHQLQKKPGSTGPH